LQSGGRTLREEVMGAQVKEAVNRKAQKCLRSELMTSNTAIPLLLLIAQTRTRLIHEIDTPHLKLISHLYDTCQVQYRIETPHFEQRYSYVPYEFSFVA